jgi:hypothetical protein
MLQVQHSNTTYAVVRDLPVRVATPHARNDSMDPETVAQKTEDLLTVTDTELDKHHVQNTDTVALDIRSSFDDNNSPPILPAPSVTTNFPLLRKRRTRIRARPPLEIKIPTRSSTATLTAGPGAYMYTPLTARTPGFESLRDDHGIARPVRQYKIVAVFKRWWVRGGDRKKRESVDGRKLDMGEGV